MRFQRFALGGVFALLLAFNGCGQDHHSLAPDSSSQTANFIAGYATPEIDPQPVFRAPTNRPGEWLTVYVFRQGERKKPPRGGGGGEECSDPNTNQAFSELGVRLPASGFSVQYHPAFEADAVAGVAYSAIDRAFSAWEAAESNEGLFDFAENLGGSSPPQRDGTNVVGWRIFTGRGGGFLAATFIWDDGTTIIESDIFYNLKYQWAVNPSIESGGTLCGELFDVQAVAAHEIGHMLGLGHVVDDGIAANGNEADATMFGSAAKGELKKQTLTSGDKSGAAAVAPDPTA